MSDADTLLKMSKEIEEAKSEQSKLEGRREALLAQLKDFGVSNIDEATELLATYRKDLDKLDESIQKSIAELKEAYQWKTI